ncbi:hypothetical protein Efla_006303 [Eimeria flavescens]
MAEQQQSSHAVDGQEVPPTSAGVDADEHGADKARGEADNNDPPSEEAHAGKRCPEELTGVSSTQQAASLPSAEQPDSLVAAEGPANVQPKEGAGPEGEVSGEPDGFLESRAALKKAARQAKTTPAEGGSEGASDSQGPPSRRSSRTDSVSTEDAAEPKRLPSKEAASSLPQQQLEEQTKAEAADAGVKDEAAAGKQSARVLQLKAMFEKRSRHPADSEAHHLTGSSTPARAAGNEGRRPSVSARRASPPSAEGEAGESPSVQLIRSRFEHLKDTRPPADAEFKQMGKSASGRKLAEETLLQLASVDIAARYGKPYRRKQNPPEADRGGSALKGRQDSNRLAAAGPAPGKRVVGGDSPVESPADAQGEAASAAPAADAGGEGGPHHAEEVKTDELRPAGLSALSPRGEAADGGANAEREEGSSSAASGGPHEQTATGTPAAAFCGRPSPEIGRLAAMVAAKVQNYGKPVPRRLLTRQDSDLA